MGDKVRSVLDTDHFGNHSLGWVGGRETWLAFAIVQVRDDKNLNHWRGFEAREGGKLHPEAKRGPGTR